MLPSRHVWQCVTEVCEKTGHQAGVKRPSMTTSNSARLPTGIPNPDNTWWNVLQSLCTRTCHTMGQNLRGPLNPQDESPVANFDVMYVDLHPSSHGYRRLLAASLVGIHADIHSLLNRYMVQIRFHILESYSGYTVRIGHALAHRRHDEPLGALR